LFHIRTKLKDVIGQNEWRAAQEVTTTTSTLEVDPRYVLRMSLCVDFLTSHFFAILAIPVGSFRGSIS
jgi:hypothetical protein